MLNIFTKLKTQNNFSNNEQILVNYILEHPQDILEMNTKQLSEKCFVSTATIYRLCEKLDLSGFSDLKVKISNSLHNYQKDDENFDFDFPVKESQTHYEIIGKIKEDYEKTLVSTANLFNLDQLKYAVKAMKKAKYIDIYTSAGNIYFAENFKFQMKEIGVEVNVPVDDYLQRLYAASGDESHLAIVISFGLRGVSTLDLLRILKEVKTPILLISAYDVKLSIQPDYRLFISSYENHYKKISSFSTRLSILYILDVLYTSYFELDYKNNIQKKVKFYDTMTQK